MDAHLPLALQIALYLVAASIVAFVAVAAPPLPASSVGFRLIRTGVKTFVRALWNGKRDPQTKARWV